MESTSETTGPAGPHVEELAWRAMGLADPDEAPQRPNRSKVGIHGE